ncbi:tyrosine-type recombinase/integrase [Flavobacterium cerinum]|uniref:Site-specific integrase n=1 Tax=Flavobacterium cerinum TaxID=2502784 RepID=A0ABY5ITD5_9FLAO|nr:site-specific integrase [Flavobacterium cerinum]UUC45596.1 site-specific integrase [Flavobacterium cerinum]
MSKILEILQTAYATAYDLKQINLNYSGPKVYNANGNIKKRWYVYYSYRNPKTGKLTRQPGLYLEVNKMFKTFESRTLAFDILKKAIEKLLIAGFNPYKEKLDIEKIISNLQDLIPGFTPKSEELKNLNPIVLKPEPTETKENGLLFSDALKYVLKRWEKTLGENSYPDYRIRINQFDKWLSENGHQNIYVTDISKRIVIDFLNDLLVRTGPKNRNNSRSVISAFFGILEEDEHIKTNFVSQIKVLKSTAKKNKTYTLTQERDLLNYLFQNDKMLDLFIKFVSYNFLRPVEVARLRVMDIDLVGKKMRFKAKNQPVKTKIIPDILLKELPDLKNLNPSNFLFTPDGFGLDWATKETNRRGYWGKRFKKVKDIFGLGDEYGLYSWRHTYITKLYYEFVKLCTPFEAKSKLMLITGHATMFALEKYLRDIDAVLPDDYSEALTKANEWLAKNPLPKAA